MYNSNAHVAHINASVTSIFLEAKKINASACLYKMPHTHHVCLIIDDKPTIINQDITPLEQLEGFIFAPFKKDSAYPAILLKKECYVEWEIGTHKWHCVYASESINDYLPASHTQSHSSANTFELKLFETSFSDYTNSVIIARNSIQDSELKKVVLAGIEQYKTEHISEPELFLKLCYQYPESFCYALYSPYCGTWVGATPETLVQRTSDNLFHTMALAGTKLYHAGEEVSETLWTQKEIEEQAYVSRYIIDCFKKIRLREFIEVGPKTIQTGRLLHLKTDFWVNMTATGFNELTGIMLNLLHPTSAVCGMPLPLALDFIQKNEKFSRKYYTGYLGPVNVGKQASSEINLFVNLRCMGIESGVATLYAGAGITLDSKPEKEYNEIKNKFLTIKSLLQMQ